MRHTQIKTRFSRLQMLILDNLPIKVISSNGVKREELKNIVKGEYPKKKYFDIIFDRTIKNMIDKKLIVIEKDKIFSLLSNHPFTFRTEILRHKSNCFECDLPLFQGELIVIGQDYGCCCIKCYQKKQLSVIKESEDNLKQIIENHKENIKVHRKELTAIRKIYQKNKDNLKPFEKSRGDFAMLRKIEGDD